ncbi:MAG: T9SS type A sorting domain-containing protein [Siphonobacter sp.]
MERKDFIQGIGLWGLGTVVPQTIRSSEKADLQPFACTLTPTEVEGPYPYPGTIPASYTSSPLYRSNIIGDLPYSVNNNGGGGTLTNVTYNGTTFPGKTDGGGIGLFLTLTIQNTDCTPVSGARVDIWHCDKRGYYSAYNTSQNGGDWTAYSFLRGIQTTDSNGQVTFISIFPSWYIPRALHFHIQVYHNSSLVLTTQLGVDDALGKTVNDSTGYNRAYTYTNATDQIFSDGYSTQLVSFNSDSNNTIGYIGTATLIAEIATTLPLTLTSFNATINSENIVILKWTSENEKNVSHFEIERSIDAAEFTKIASVTAANTESTNQYTYADLLIDGRTYYRLKMVDLDGKYEYSRIISVEGKAFLDAIIFPNPVKDKLNIQHLNTDDNTVVKIVNIAGMVISQKKVPANISYTSFDVSAFSAGTYLLVIETNSGRQAVKFIKQ